MEKLPTAEDFFLDSYLGKSISKKEKELWLSCNSQAKETTNIMVEFAKLHVEAALKAASEKAFWDKETRETWFGDMNRDDCDFQSTDGDGVPYELHKVVINKDSILNSYPLENIK